MNLRVNRIAYPVTTLGPGRRIALWVQGCSRHCPGCASTDTWDSSKGAILDIDDLASTIVHAVANKELDGLSITGGEPAEQASSVVALVETVQSQIKNSSFNVLIFTGYTRGEIEQQFPALMKQADVLVCGPYNKLLPRLNCLVASDNQEMVVVNDDLRPALETYIQSFRQALQFDVKESGVYFVGIPNAGDLDRFEEKLAKHGVILGEASWRN